MVGYDGGPGVFWREPSSETEARLWSAAQGTPLTSGPLCSRIMRECYNCYKCYNYNVRYLTLEKLSLPAKILSLKVLILIKLFVNEKRQLIKRKTTTFLACKRECFNRLLSCSTKRWSLSWFSLCDAFVHHPGILHSLQIIIVYLVSMSNCFL